MKARHVYKLHIKYLKKLQNTNLALNHIAQQHNALVARVEELEAMVEEQKPRKTGFNKQQEVK